jgi:hypothetical protein
LSAPSTSIVVSFTSANTFAATSSHAGDIASVGLSTGAKAGVGVGVAVVMILAIAVMVLLLRLRKSGFSKQGRVVTTTPGTAVVTVEHKIKHQPQMQVHESGGYETAELEQTNRAELGSYNVPQELEAEGYGLR